MKHFKYKSLLNDQRGVASTVVVILVMTILTLIVIGMSQTANKEQRQALDRELSTQAVYAAESGISDVLNYLDENPPPASPPRKTECVDNPSLVTPPNPNSSNVTADGNVKYTCALYDQTPLILEYSSIGTDRSELIPISSTDGVISNITLSWQDKGGSSPLCNGASPTPASLPSTATYACGIGALRIELIDIRNPAAVSRTTLTNNLFTAFLFPRSGGASPTPVAFTTVPAASTPAATTPRLINAGCINAPTPPRKKCSVQINNLNVPQNERMFLRIKSIYRDSEVAIENNGGGAAAIGFAGAQVVIDVTGRANDVLKRIQVRSPIRDKHYFPEFGLQSTDSICKLIQIDSDATNNTYRSTNLCDNPPLTP